MEQLAGMFSIKQYSTLILPQGLQVVWSNDNKGLAINGDGIPLQPPGGVSGVPGAQPLLPNTMDPTRQQSPYQGKKVVL